MTAILALDLATATGWAFAHGVTLESGVQTFDVRRGESPGMRFLRFRAWLGEVTMALPPGPGIAYEAPHHRGGAATEIAVGFSTRVQEHCAAHGYEHAAVHSATLKKWAAGSGRADKTAMVAAVQAKGWARHRNGTALDDNEADALALLHYALEVLLPGAPGGRAP